MIRLERRPTPSRAWQAAAPLLAVALTMVAGGLMFAALGTAPLEALRTIFWDPLFGEFAWYFRGQLLVKAGPLILIAVGLALGFRAGIWNIGAEGQYIFGAIMGAAAGLAFYPAETRLIFPLMVFCGALGGFAWAMIPALLKIRFGTNEILVSLMLVYVAENVLASAAVSWLRNPDATGFPGSRNLSRWEASANPELVAGTGAHWGVLTAVLAVVAAHVLLTRHLTGFHIRLAGAAPRAARFAGVPPARLIILCLGLSGALAGLAGLFEVTGPAGQISIDFASGYGFTAIIVAFLGRLQPLGILAAGLLMALTYVGGDNAATNLGLPVAAISAFQGMLLFFLLALDVLANFRMRFGRKKVLQTHRPHSPTASSGVAVALARSQQIAKDESAQ
ncbi:MAG: ABC transporter permease [Pseudomonadota bacterium]